MNHNETEPIPRGWLNPTVIGAGLTSFLADVCYEMAAAILPGFLRALQLPAALIIGIVEGSADATSNLAKLGVGWYSDRLERRKPFVLLGYGLTGISQSFFALATGWPLILFAKLVGWFGKGIRGPLRNAILADAVAPGDRGKAFGFHRAGDTLGAVLGPLLGFALLRWLPPESFADATGPHRFIFWLTLIPGIGSVATFAFLIRERRRQANPQRKFWASIRSLPKPFHRLLLGVGIFGLGDCSDKLLIVVATQLLAPILGEREAISLGVLLYSWRNLIGAGVAFPVGVISDRVGPRRPLIGGYILGVLTMLGFAAATQFEVSSVSAFVLLFAMAGIYLSTEDALESVLTADLVPDRSLRGTAFGLMGTVNGLGDLFSSLIVGLLMEFVSVPAAFVFAASMMLLGTILLARGAGKNE